VGSPIPIVAKTNAKKQHLIPHFTLSRKKNLRPFLYKRLKQWVAEEDNYIYDNKEDLELEIEEKLQESVASE